MDSRQSLQLKLEEILGSSKVYFQPPVSTSMEYPCIRFELNRIESKFANNLHYKKVDSYTVTFITRTVLGDTNGIVEKIMSIPYTKNDRVYTQGGLYHYVFSIKVNHN